MFLKLEFNFAPSIMDQNNKRLTSKATIRGLVLEAPEQLYHPYKIKFKDTCLTAVNNEYCRLGQ